MNIDNWFDYDLPTLQNKLRLLNLLVDFHHVYVSTDFIILKNTNINYCIAILSDLDMKIAIINQWLYIDSNCMKNIKCFSDFYIDGNVKLPNSIICVRSEYINGENIHDLLYRLLNDTT